MNNALVAPLMVGTRAIGFVMVGRRARNASFSDLDLDVLNASLGMVAVAFENRRLYSRLEEQNRGLARANKELRELDRMKSLSPFLAEFHESRRSRVAQHHPEFVLMSEARDVFVRADRVRLAQILDVLVDNAVKFTPAGTRIELRIRVGEDAWVQVDVADQGPGIAPDQLPLMFKPFRQVDGSATRRVGGLGMGLATASRIAEQMGARLGVETAAGRGATFTVSLPRP